MKILLLFLAIIVSHTSELKFNFSKSKVQSNRYWARIGLSIQGYSGHYELAYTSLPQNWKQVKNYVYLPKKDLKKKRKYPCQVIVRDESDNQLKKTVLFVTKNNKVFVDDQTYPYEQNFTDSFFKSDGYKEKPTCKTLEDLDGRIENLRIRRKNTFQKKKKLWKNKFSRRTVQTSTRLVKTIGCGLKKIFSEIFKFKNVEREDFSDKLNSRFSQRKQFGDKYKYSNNYRYSQKVLPGNFNNIVKNYIKTYSEKNQQIQKVQQLVKTETSKTTKQRSIESIFSRLPSSKELDEIIRKADQYLIVRTIQEVVSSDNMGCEQKIAYLLDFVGRIKSALSMKTFTLNKLKVITEQAQKQIQRLFNEIQYLNDEIQKLQIEEKRNLLKIEMDYLEQAYNKFNYIDSKIQPKQEAIVKIQKQVSNLKNVADYSRKELVNKKLSLTEADAEISQLQQQLKSAKQKKYIIEDQIQNITFQIQDVDDQIISLQQNTKALQEQIKELERFSDELKIKYTQLQISAERMRNDLIEYVDKRDQYQTSIEEFEGRIIIEEDKLTFQEIQVLTNMTTTLSSSIPTVQQKIDAIYYECHKVKELKKQVQDNTLVYIVNPQNFQNYIRNTYGSSQISSITSTVTLNTVNILDPLWEQEYGISHYERQIASSQEFSFSSDFNCLNPSTLVGGKGKIINIAKNTISVQVPGVSQTAYLKLSPCSRLESTKKIPKVGQKIYWKGNVQDNDHYQVYTASCI